MNYITWMWSYIGYCSLGNPKTMIGADMKTINHLKAQLIEQQGGIHEVVRLIKLIQLIFSDK